jgi:hypothetical protein
MTTALRSFPHPFRNSLFAAAIATAALATGCTAQSSDPSATEDSSSSEDAVSGSVASAVTNSCSTSSVSGLSKQIIDEARCMSSSTYTSVPDLGNISFGGSVYRYLEKPARDQLVNALKAHSGTSMTVNSMLRTIAQQYLLYTWYKTGRCGIGLAATPGNSNHETGLALDVSQYGTWKGTLQAYGFHWLGSSDPVHFDYAGAGAKSYRGVDVEAFQRLWNRNHPEDKIATDGEWGPQTEARMKKSPAGGFAKGATCSAPADYQGDAVIAAADGDDEADIAIVDTEVAVESAHVEGTAPVANGESSAAKTAVDTAADDRCASCFQAICDTNARCCETEWDASCVATGLELCEALCGKDAMQPL